MNCSVLPVLFNNSVYSRCFTEISVVLYTLLKEYVNFYSGGTIKYTGLLENGEYGLVSDAINTIVEIEKQIKDLKSLQDSYKENLLKEMEENNVLKIDTEELSISYVAPSTRETLDSKKLKEDLPDIYDLYVKFTDVKSSLRIKVK